ncbi:hypothetical protein [Vibrio diabolicus]
MYLSHPMNSVRMLSSIRSKDDSDMGINKGQQSLAFGILLDRLESYH